MFDGAEYLVAWLEDTGSERQIQGAKIPVDGGSRETFTIIAGDVDYGRPAVASDLAGHGNVAFRRQIEADQVHTTLVLPDPALRVENAAVTEPDTGSVSVEVPVSLDYASDATISVDYVTVDGSATAGSDYTAASGTLTYLPGEVRKTVPISILGDPLVEGNERFTVRLQAPENATIADNAGLVVISDNDEPSLSIDDVNVSEGDGTTNPTATFTVSMSAASGSEVTVSYATADGTAAAGADYTAASGTLTFPAGTTSQTIEVSILSDSIDEYSEVFTVSLSGATNATIAEESGLGRILDDDPLASLSVTDTSVIEGDAGETTSMAVRIHLSAATEKDVQVTASTADGTATAGEDYTANIQPMPFPPGQAARTLVVQVLGDDLDEGDETLRILLSNPIDATIAHGEGLGTIIDDDGAGVPDAGTVVPDAGTGTGDAGAGAADAGAGAADAGAGAADAGTGPADAAAGAADAADAARGAASGCGCTSATGSAPASWAALSLLTGLALRLRRRRR